MKYGEPNELENCKNEKATATTKKREKCEFRRIEV